MVQNDLVRGNGVRLVRWLAAGCLVVGCSAQSHVATSRPSSPPTATVPPTASTDAEGDSARVTAAHDSGAYGIGADLTYVSAAGEHLGISVLTVPRCETSSLGAAPLLVFRLVDAAGAQVTRHVPVADLQLLLAQVARTWCGHGVMAALQTGQGDSPCYQWADLLVQNPRPVSAVLLIPGSPYAATGFPLAAGGSATLHLLAAALCSPSSSHGTATVDYADGGHGTLVLNPS